MSACTYEYCPSTGNSTLTYWIFRYVFMPQVQGFRRATSKYVYVCVYIYVHKAEFVLSEAAELYTSEFLTK